MKLAAENGIESIAFPSISTGVYRFPFERACRIAVTTVGDFVKKNESIKRVIFACFSDSDYETYVRILEDLSAS
jgi:O-acetyl-ADP-ribose deacetylase (regulator of RNase III)